MSAPGEININDKVRVQLTPLGVAILKRQHAEERRAAPSLGEFKPPAVDAEGYSEFQLWVLMGAFGPHLRNGGPMPMATMIKIGPSK